jgi:hypothetical protein
VNEVDWLTGTDPAAMLAHLEGKASERKARLFACACVRRYWGVLRYPTQRNAVETAERFADELAGDDDLREARERAEEEQAAYGAPMYEEFVYTAAAACCGEDAMETARNVCELLRRQAVRDAAAELAPGEDEAGANAQASAAECRAQAALLREAFGNPFRPSVLRPEWLSWGNGAAVAIARVISDEGLFGDLPYLADALLDAGCTDEAVLRHCHEPAGHVRGCWVVDAILGRTP